MENLLERIKKIEQIIETLGKRGIGNALTMKQLAADPATPSSGNTKIYGKTDGKIYKILPSGTIVELGIWDKPYFEAQYAGAIGPGNTVVWGTELYDNLNSYNASTGIFTAPIAGFYLFGFNILMPNANAGEFRLAFYKNGAIHDSFIAQKAAGAWQTIQGTLGVYLAVNNTMKIQYESGTGNLYADGNYNKFWGCLI